MASAELSRRVEKVVGYPPLCDLGADRRRKFHEALLEAGSFEDLPGWWQAAILEAEQNRPNLRLVGGDWASSNARASKSPSKCARRSCESLAAHGGGPRSRA